METFEILDGVRRAKAAQLSGQETIEARIQGVGPVMIVRLEVLWSRKDQIETSGIRGMDWDRILRATQRGEILPPIEITPTGCGVPLFEIDVEEGLDAFRNSF